jgi:hypothetical protein
MKFDVAQLMTVLHMTKPPPRGNRARKVIRAPGAAGRAARDFLRVFERRRKFVFRQIESDSGLNADFKEEYSKGPATKIARILHGSKCDVYVVFCR